MITVVLWKWGDLFTCAHVNRLARAIKRNLHITHEIVCIADDLRGLDDDIILTPLPYSGGKRNGRRLWIFSDEARYLGSTLLQIDLDMIITGDITPLVESFLANNRIFQVWKCKMSSRYKYGLNPSFMMLKTGYYDYIWKHYHFNPEERLHEANRAGWPASDQAIISHEFTRVTGERTGEPTCPVWTSDDGIISMRDELIVTSQAPHAHIHTPLPPGTRLVSFHGRFDPNQFIMLDWVREHWLGEDPRS